MKLVHPSINELLDFNKNSIYILCIENPSFYYELVSDIMEEYKGGEGKCIFSEREKEIPAKKCVELITDFIDFDINKTTILTKVNSAIEQKAMDEYHFEETQRLLAFTEKYIEDIILSFDANFYCDKLTISQIIKACGIKADTEPNNLVDKIYTYMNLVREFLGEKLFVFVNLHSFIDESSYAQFCNMIKLHDFQVLFLENKNYDSDSEAKTVIIDKDLCLI